ncbi:MAG: hypothetical protein WCF24_03330 [Acidimicrobiales bacterium]
MAEVQMQPHEIENLRRDVEAVSHGSPCGLSRETALMVLTQFKEVKLERDSLLAELVAAGLG